MKKIVAVIAFAATSVFAHDHVYETVEGVGKTRQGVLVTKTESVQSLVGNAYAEFHPDQNECLVKVGREIKTAGDETFALNPIWPKFLAYHEFAHCDLYGEPTKLIGNYSASSLQSSLFDAYVQMHMIKLDEDFYEGLTIQPIIAYHELFADSVALMKMRKDGHSKEQLAFVRVMRNAAAFSRSHDTLYAFDMVNSMSDDQINSMSTEQMFAMAKTIAAKGLLDKLALSKPNGDGSAYMLGMRFKSQLQNVIDQSGRNQLKVDSYITGDGSSMLKYGYAFVAGLLEKADTSAVQRVFGKSLDDATQALADLSVSMEK